MSFVYLASPYSHKDPGVRALRYREALRCTAWLLRQQIWVYSPIVHSHEVGRIHELPFEYEFWHAYNSAMILAAKEIWVLTIQGWRSSRGIEAEIEFAKKENFVVQEIKPQPCSSDYKILPHEFRSCP